MQWDYLTALLLFGGFSLFIRPTWKIGFALIAVWCFCTAAVYVTGDYTPWKLNAFANIAATVFVMRHPANKVGSFIGGTLLVQALIDLAYGAANNDGQAMQYLDIQTRIAWLQLLIVAGWHGGRIIRHSLRRGYSKASAAYHARLGNR